MKIKDIIINVAKRGNRKELTILEGESELPAAPMHEKNILFSVVRGEAARIIPAISHRDKFTRRKRWDMIASLDVPPFR